MNQTQTHLPVDPMSGTISESAVTLYCPAMPMEKPLQRIQSPKLHCTLRGVLPGKTRLISTISACCVSRPTASHTGPLSSTVVPLNDDGAVKLRASSIFQDVCQLQKV